MPIKETAEIIQLHQLSSEIEIIKSNHLKHMADDIDELKQGLKENRTFFQDRLDRLDSRIWWIMGIAVTTLVSIIVEKFI